MSNYGPSYPTGGQPPGGQPYGDPYGGGQQPRGTDGVSITGFVLSLTCCLSFVGAILGFIGLGRTKNNQRKGRWAAISAIIIGILGTLVAGGVTAFFVFVASQLVTPGNAEVGQCADVSTEDGATALNEVDCDDEHDAEVVFVGEYSEIQEAREQLGFDADEDSSEAIASACAWVMDEDYEHLARDAADYRLTLFTFDTDSPEPDDDAVCYIERVDGDALEGSLAE